MENNESVVNQITAILDRLRPYLNGEGGDLEFVKFEDGIVYVRMLGACQGCMMQDDTLKDGIEAILMENIPEVLEVRNVGDSYDEGDVK